METSVNVFDSLAIILPSLDPDEKFSGVVKGLVEAGFKHIVVVDDGSKEENKHFFTEAAENPGVTLLIHDVNKGKGRALKDAIRHIADNMPEVLGAVTIDGDGQHLLPDIIKCGDRLLECKDKVIIGCRDFDQEGVPARSVTGNKLTSRMFRIFFGIKITDTQTGLRAVPAQFFNDFCEIEGERFEYETNMLLQMKKLGIGFVEQTITTVYDPDDYSSHYNAFKDSYRIFKIMFKFMVKK